MNKKKLMQKINTIIIIITITIIMTIIIIIINFLSVKFLHSIEHLIVFESFFINTKDQQNYPNSKKL